MNQVTDTDRYGPGSTFGRAQRAAEVLRDVPSHLGIRPAEVVSGEQRVRFEEDLLDLAASNYVARVPDAELVTFSHGTATYLFDASEARAARTVLVIGRPEHPSAPRDANYQRGYPMPELHAHRAVDRGHFIPYTSGGLYGPNLFVQDRALNRGWSESGRRYRALERLAIAEAPRSLLFALPHYIDHSNTPEFLNLGVMTASEFHVDTFRNRYDHPETLSLQEHLTGATDGQFGALGEETASVLIEDDLDGVLVAMGDAAMPRTEGRQDLDVVAIVEGALTVFEVKTRYLSRQAGRVTRAGNLLRPRMRRPGHPSGNRQGSQRYVAERLAAFVDTDGADYVGVDVRVLAIDFKSMLAQQFSVNDAGTRLTPHEPPVPCLSAAEQALAKIIAHRGHL